MHHRRDEESKRSLRVVTTEPCLQLRVNEANGGVMLRPQRYPDSLPPRGAGAVGKRKRRATGNSEEDDAAAELSEDKKAYTARYGEQSVVQPGEFYVHKTVYSFDLGK